MKLKEIINKFDKSYIKAGDGLEKGEYPLYTCSPLVNKFLDDYIYDGEAIIISTGGNFSIHYVNGKFNYSTDCYVFNTDKLDMKYLYYYLMSKTAEINKLFRGAGLKHLNKNEFLLMDVDVIDIQKQKKIVVQLDKVNNLIELRKNQLNKIENLIKSQFVEMFGDIKNSKWKKEKMEVLTEKITDGKHGGCQSEENSGYYYIGATEIYNDKINYEHSNQITKKDFEKDYARCDLQLNDFVIVNTGATIGKSAIVVDNRCNNTLLQKSVALIRTKKDKLLPLYLKYCYENDSSLYNKGQGCARINLLLSQIRDTYIPLPPIDLQNKFAEFVKQIDNQKFEFEKSLNKLKEIQSALMQEYFG